MKKIMFVIIVSGFFYFMSTSSAYAQAPITVTFERTYQSNQPIIDRTTTYDYSPTAILDSDGRTKVWYCSGDSAANGVPGDVIAYSSLASGQTDQSPITVLNHSGNSLWNDGQHACAPTVVKHSTPNIHNGQEMYSMYYECQQMFFDNRNLSNPSYTSGPVQICHAISSDGVRWQILGENDSFSDPSTTNPKALFTYSQKAKDNCHLSFTNNKYWLDPTADCKYGVGHPSAIVKNVDGKEQIWLWYYDDTRLDENTTLVYLTKSFDGINFDTPVPTNMTRKPFNVVYVDIPVGNLPGYYLGTTNFADPVTGREGNSIFTYSVDGISWTSPENTDMNLLKIGQASGQSAAGPNTIVSDPYGIIHSTEISHISGEGDRSNAQTWALWLTKGNFTASINNTMCNSFATVHINSCDSTVKATSNPRNPDCVTSSTSATLHLSSIDATHVSVAENVPFSSLCTDVPDSSFGNPTAYTPTINITLPSGTGDKKVCVKLTNPGGVSAKCGGTIYLNSSSYPGDLDSDSDIDIFDYNLLVGNFGKTGSNIIGDIVNNGKVDIFDYNALVTNFGK